MVVAFCDEMDLPSSERGPVDGAVDIMVVLLMLVLPRFRVERVARGFGGFGSGVIENRGNIGVSLL